MLEIIVKSEKVEKTETVNRVLELIDEQKEWKAAYQGTKDDDRAYAPQKETRYVFVPEVKQVETYKLFFGNEPMKMKTEPQESYTSEKKSAEERRGTMAAQEGAQMAERIRYAKWFGTLNELPAQDKEDWVNSMRASGINRVWRHLWDGSYSRMKGHHGSM